MKKLLLALLLTPAILAAKSPRGSFVVNTAWLAAHLHDPGLVLLHVGDKDEYAAKHIPGARHVSLSDIAVTDHTPTGLILEMPPTPEDLRERLAKLGISDHSRVVVYYGKDWVSPATRVIFTLDYAGLGDRALLLDGGMGAWVRDGHAVTDVVPAARAGTLSPLKTRKIIVDADFVRANLGKKGIAVVDGRTAAFYDGLDTGGAHGQSHKTGHIAGAGNFPYVELADENLMLRSADEWRALLTKAGVKPGDTVLGYCHIGQQTTAALFAARTLGHKVLLYDGSMQDWSRREGYPVENPAAK
ncbi:MAG TPA: rhodanese-like domain-containing protein [Thermoanaerobaculia bacterium]|nr:rhodanese-like domain-containing protein [Thermoanaerobaculia bacterium]